MNKLVNVPLADITPCDWNPRAIDVTSADLAELAASMQAHGQLQPGVARAKDDDYELLAGRRRYEALKIAGIDRMLLVVAKLDDHDAKDVTVLENLQRENLSPLEEARGVQTLLDDGRDVKEIAAKMGKTPQWILRRAKLTAIIPAALEFLRKAKHDLSVPALEALARLTPGQQAWAISEEKYMFNDSDRIVRYADGLTRRLKKAGWDLEDATLFPEAGACDSCARRSSRQPGLFDDELDPEKIKADDTCIDGQCFTEKARLFAEVTAKAAEAKGKPLVRVSNTYGDRAPKNCLPRSSYTECKKSDKGSVATIITHTSDSGTAEMGRRIYIKPDRSALKDIPKDAKAKPEEKPERSTEDRQKTLTQRRQASALRALQEAVTAAPRPCPAWYTLPRLFRLVWRFNIHFEWSDPVNMSNDTKADIVLTDDFDTLMAEEPANAIPGTLDEGFAKKHPFQRIWVGVRRQLANTCGFASQDDINAERIAWAEACCQVIGHNWADYLKAAEEAIPTPKILQAALDKQEASKLTNILSKPSKKAKK